jgi:hypothetical protein
VICCTPFLSLFSISFQCTGSSPSSFIAWFLLFVLAYLHLPALYHLVLSSCWKFHDSAAWLATLLFLRTNQPSSTPKFIYHSRQSTWKALSFENGKNMCSRNDGTRTTTYATQHSGRLFLRCIARRLVRIHIGTKSYKIVPVTNLL